MKKVVILDPKKFRAGDVIMRAGLDNADFGSVYRCTGDELVLIKGVSPDVIETYTIEWDVSQSGGWSKLIHCID